MLVECGGWGWKCTFSGERNWWGYEIDAVMVLGDSGGW